MYLTKKGGPKKRAADVEKLRQDFLINDLLTTSNQKIKKGEDLQLYLDCRKPLGQKGLTIL